MLILKLAAGRGIRETEEGFVKKKVPLYLHCDLATYKHCLYSKRLNIKSSVRVMGFE